MDAQSVVSCRTIRLFRRALYAYRQRPGSLMTDKSSRLLHELSLLPGSSLAFVNGQKPPKDILSIWSNHRLAMLFWLMYHPITSRRHTDVERKQAWDLIRQGNGWQKFRAFSSHASLARRLAMPLIALSARGCQWPAKFFFRHIYYPLATKGQQ